MKNWICKPATLIFGLMLASSNAINAADSPAVRASRHQFPRIANQIQNYSPSDQTLAAAAYWDLLVMDAEAIAKKPSAFGELGSLRTKNPNIITLGYFSSADIVPGSINTQIIGNFIKQLQNGWYFKDTAGNKINLYELTPNNWTNMLNLTTGVNQFMPDYLQQSVISTGKLDGIFYDWMSANVAWINHRTPNPNAPLDINNDGQADSDAVIDAQWISGMNTLLNNSHNVYPADTIVMGNGGWREGTTFDPKLNGMLIEQFLAGELGNPSFYGWSGVMKSYRDHLANGLQPNLTILMGNRDSATDTSFMRFTLASTLMGDGYFSFTNGDSVPTGSQSAPYDSVRWYDEFAVDLLTGLASEPSLQHKGYLGMPLSEAYNPLSVSEKLNATLDLGGTLAQNKPWRRDFENGIALVNPAPNSVVINLGKSYRKISGGVDPVFNNGARITSITLPSRSGAVLLNDTLPNNQDTQAPNAPNNLTATAVSQTQINLAWTASSDNTGVAGYFILRDGTLIARTANLTYQDLNLDTSKIYRYILVAYDANGNVSLQSASASNANFKDTTPPSPPARLIATPVSSTEIDLTWDPSTDNVGVKGYSIIRDGVFTGKTVVGTSFQDTGLNPDQTYVYTVVAFDAVFNASAQSNSATAKTLPIAMPNQAPTANAGADQTITLPSQASISGTASDDGLPTPASLSYTWTKVSGSGIVTFVNDKSLNTSVSFSAAGTYVLRLTASDSVLSTSDDITIIVNPAPPVNQAPTVNAGADQTITLPSQASISGTASDDGLPTPASLSYSWTKVSGSGIVTFANDKSLNTSVTFSAAGTYVLRLTVTDSLLSTSDDITITVNPAPPVNQAPTANAGADQTITLPSQASISGTASDDSLPTPASLSYTWTKVSGPGIVTFANDKSLNTSVTFSAAGIYVLRLTVTDSLLSTSDDITITVNPAPPVNQAPTVNAGADQTITLPSQASISGTASDDDPTASLTYLWTKVSGPGTVAFSNEKALNTSVTFSAAGTYVLNLTANDGNSSGSDDITIKVAAAPAPAEGFVFPNPAVGGAAPVIKAMIGKADRVTIDIYNTSGANVHSAEIRGEDARVANGEYYYEYAWTEGQASGIYFAHIKGETGSQTVKTKIKFAVVH